MAPNDIDLLTVQRGLVIAPAGCGKTQLIVEALKRHVEPTPILVLTHTNAGVAALRNRLEKAKVRPSTFRLLTIDGFAIRLVGMFPGRAEIDLAKLTVERPPYPEIRTAACNVLQTNRIYDAIRATYSRLLVDEYQDCSQWQHAIVYYLSHVLPTCVLGDQLQAIFGFGDDALADWEEHVGGHFPLAAELTTPHRWIKAGAAELGQWVLAARSRLLSGQTIDLRQAPSTVEWVQLDGSNGDRPKQLKAGATKPHTSDGNVLIIGDSTNPRSQQLFASQIPGATVVEAVDLRELVNFASQLDLTAADAVHRIVDFAASLMTGTSPDELIQRLATITSGRSRKAVTALEQSALDFLAAPTYGGVAALFAAINNQAGVRVHRPAVLRACFRALSECAKADGPEFKEAAVRAREQYRMAGRSLPKRGVGSTLLLKGLEAEVCVVVEGDKLNAKNLYVALTRGSNKLIVCSKSPVLPVVS
jgi:DNA helicase-2/ATP-dependent DNA helicase PcrA